MSNYNCDYVRRHYGVPAEIGRRVIANDARHYVQRVWAANRSQAKDRAYQELAECFNDDATAMLSF